MSSVGTIIVPFNKSAKSPTVVALAGVAVTWSDDITAMTGARPRPLQSCQDEFVPTTGHVAKLDVNVQAIEPLDVASFIPRVHAFCTHSDSMVLTRNYVIKQQFFLHSLNIRISARRGLGGTRPRPFPSSYGVQTKGHGTKGHRQKATRQKATETKGHGTKGHRTQRQDATDLSRCARTTMLSNGN